MGLTCGLSADAAYAERADKLGSKGRIFGSNSLAEKIGADLQIYFPWLPGGDPFRSGLTLYSP